MGKYKNFSIHNPDLDLDLRSAPSCCENMKKVTSFFVLFFFFLICKIDLQCFLKLQQEADKIVDFDTLQGKSVQCYFTSYHLTPTG